jgi:DNA-binding transcriptional regulator YdaS (Cro superfamily)
MDIGLKIAIRAAGGVRSLARKLGVTHGTIVQWDRVPYVWLDKVEKATGIGREKLRPELFRDFERTKEVKVKELESA